MTTGFTSTLLNHISLSFSSPNDDYTVTEGYD
jgi:hypothetical protein